MTDEDSRGRHIMDDVAFWSQVIKDSERTVIVPRHLEDAARAATAHIPTVTVKGAQEGLLPPGIGLVVDHNAIEASLRESLQHWTPRFW